MFLDAKYAFWYCELIGRLNNTIKVRLYVQMNRTDGGAGDVKLMTNFPKKVQWHLNTSVLEYPDWFQVFGDEDYDNTLENLGLVPSAVLIVTK